MGAAPILTILRNGETLKSQPIEGEVSLGRGEGCVIRLEDRAISRNHAVFRAAADGVQIEKKSDFAPISVNGAECTQALLKEGDVVSIGPYLMRVTIPKEPPKPAPPPAKADAPGTDSLALAADTASGEAGAAPAADPAGSDAGASAGGDASSVPPGDAPPGDALAGLDGLGGDAAAGLPAVADGGAEAAPAASPPEEPVDTGPVDEDGKTKLTPQAKLSVKLIFPEGAANHLEYDVTKDEISVGRGKNCDLVLINDKKASRKHAIIRRAGLSFMIKDLDSANGTFVNGVKVQEQELSGEDMIRIGDVEFQFKALSADYESRQQDFMPVPEEAPPSDEPLLPEGAMGAPMGMEPLPGAPPMGGVDPAIGGAPPPGADLSGVPGITGIPGAGDKGKKQGFVDKYIKNFKTLPPKQKVIVVAVAAAFFYFMVLDEEPVAKKKVEKKQAVVAPTGAGAVTFEALSPEQKRFVQTQHDTAFDYYKNKDYDKTLFEIRKIFSVIPDYLDSKEIERYAQEGKRKLDALEDEKHKKEEEERLKARIAALVQETKEKMDKKDYDGAKEMFPQVLAVDPDNIQVANWRKQIEEYDEAKKLEAQQKSVQEDINKRAWEIYNEALTLKKAGKCHSAIEVFAKVSDIGASDPEPTTKAKEGIHACHSAINGARDPVLAEAKQLETAGEFSKAFALFKKATKIDPPHPAGYAGMSRIRGILHERAKAIYVEGVLAESYSDYSTARRRFKEVLDAAPAEDDYHQKALHKLTHYFRKEEAPQ